MPRYHILELIVIDKLMGAMRLLSAKTWSLLLQHAAQCALTSRAAPLPRQYHDVAATPSSMDAALADDI